jgi:RNA polymerase sigma factor (sigma-70 family)
MDEQDWLAGRFEEQRAHLRGVAYRMLGSLSEAEDAVQEAWLRVSRADTGGVQNLGGWLTTVVARVCLDMLRSQRARREDALDAPGTEPVPSAGRGADPEREALLAESVGLALLVVLDTLAPPERLAFVLHDMFAVPFEEIAPLVERTPAAARQLASRARRRVQGAAAVPATELTRQRAVVDAFLGALRRGDFQGLVAVLDPDVVVRAGERVIRGAEAWAGGALTYSRAARWVQPALVDGSVGLVMAPRGRLRNVLRFGFAGGKIATVEVVTEPERLATLDLAVLEG